ncbi:hypothetical protein E4U36_007382 [Claviceps purpurea]|nr:hypothetical protein E4U36_007382 [Claviceps purpurea]
MQPLLQTAVHRLSHSELLTQYTFSSGNQCNFKLVGSSHHEASVVHGDFQQSYSTNIFITLSDSISHGVPRDPNHTTMPLHLLRGQATRLPF